MKVTFPHMGNMYIAVGALLSELGIEYIVPPPPSKKTIELGVKYAPEFACMPLKLNLGNFIEAWELGADTIIMGGGTGPCRFGYYAQVEYDILKDLGCNYELFVIEPPEHGAGELLGKIKSFAGNKTWWQLYKAMRFAFAKAKAVDELEMLALAKRPREAERGSTDHALNEWLNKINLVTSTQELNETLMEAKAAVTAIDENPSKKPLKVALVGEIFTVLEPFANYDLEKKLGYLGVEVDRSIYLSEWVGHHLLNGYVRGVRKPENFTEAACPYLNHFVGGHGLESVGNTVISARKGYDGAVQLLPFSCMPEIVAESILPVVSKDLSMPVFTVVVDEHSAEAGLVTRLEAFTDLLYERRKRNKILNFNK